jgi:predicted phosphodiesterase
VRIGLLSDAHGNIEAFEYAVALLSSSDIDATYYLGDSVGYIPGPEVVSSLERLDVTPILGNHEHMLLNNDYSSTDDDAYQLSNTRASMSNSMLRYVRSWPIKLQIEFAERIVIMVHGSLADPVRGYVYPDTELNDISSETPVTVFMGATHRPFARKIGNTSYINVGSCGLPRDSGDMGSVVLYDVELDHARILRFEIGELSSHALSRVGHVHQVVRETLDRRGPFEGEVV